jgi:uncharacterized protein YuzE
MKVNYYPETDSLYIELSEKSSTDRHEVSEGIVLDYDENGHLVLIDIDNATRKVHLNEIFLKNLPFDIRSLAA